MLGSNLNLAAGVVRPICAVKTLTLGITRHSFHRSAHLAKQFSCVLASNPSALTMVVTREITVALDWYPNTNHTGFYVAKSRGLYAAAGLQVALLSPHEDAYKRTPASRLVDRSVAFASVPSETVISFHTAPPELQQERPPIVAVAALLQDSTSAVVTLKSSGIDRPSKLDGKSYASYAARYEGRIVQQMIRNDGGKGEYKELTPPMLDIWNQFIKGDADATWVFLGWEGIKAARDGVELNAFKLEDYGIQYGYSPVLATHPELLRDEPDMVRSFLAATAQGYEYAAAHPEEAAAIFLEEVANDVAATGKDLPEPLDKDMVIEAQKFTSQHYLDASKRWGVMDLARWDAFLDWLSSSGLLTTKVQSRGQEGSNTTSLDGLRAGDVGEPVPRESVQSDKLANSSFLPEKQ